jgi:hypothetical protein
MPPGSCSGMARSATQEKLPGGWWLRSWPSRLPATRAGPSRNLAPCQGRSSSRALHLDRGPEPGSTSVRVDGRRDGWPSYARASRGYVRQSGSGL